MKIGDHIRVELDHAETGHGSIVGFNPTVIRIDNIPFDGPWNLHDTALAEPATERSSGLYKPTQLVERKYSMRTIVAYAAVKQFRDFAKEVTEAGGAVEGWTPVSAKHRGMAGVAHTPDVGVREIAKRHGCTIETTKVFGVPS